MFKQYANIVKEQKSEEAQASSRNENKPAKCSVCSDIVDNSRTTLICPETQCNAVSHLQCLANRFLDEENSENLVIPVMGRCPSCGAEMSWIELITSLSNRIHGSKDLKKAKRITKDRTQRIQSNSSGASCDLAVKINPYSDMVSKEHLSEG